MDHVIYPIFHIASSYIYLLFYIRISLSLSLVMVLLDFILRLENQVRQSCPFFLHLLQLKDFYHTRVLLKLVVGNELGILPTLLQKRRFHVIETSGIMKH